MTVNLSTSPFGLTTRKPSLMLTDLMPEIVTWDSEFSEIEGLNRHLAILPDALISDTNSIPLDQEGRSRLFTKVGAPSAYLAERSVDVQILALREHFEQGGFGDSFSAVLRNGEFFTICSSRLVETTNTEVLTAVAESLGENADSLSVSKISYEDGRLELDLVSPAKSLEVRRGDVVTGGLHVQHSRYRGEATQVHAYVYRLVCENGMTRRECVSSERIARTRKLPADHPRAKELLLDQVRRLTAQTWAKLDAQLSKLRATNERTAYVHQLLRQWLQRARISARVTDGSGGEYRRTVMDRLLEAWSAEGGEDTYYGAVNALTRVGSHDPDLSRRQRRVLSLLGGLLAFSGVHICPRCFSVLSESNRVCEQGATEACSTPDGDAQANLEFR